MAYRALLWAFSVVFISFVSFCSYKLGRFRHRREVQHKIEDASTAVDEVLEELDEANRVKVQSIEKAEQNRLAAQHAVEQAEQYRLAAQEQRAANALLLAQLNAFQDMFASDQRFEGDSRAALHDALGLLSRRLEEAESHFRSCPCRDEIFIAPRGSVWHIDPNCRMLSQAATINSRDPCSCCASDIISPYHRHPLTGMSLLDEIRLMHQTHGHVSYADRVVNGRLSTL